MKMKIHEHCLKLNHLADTPEQSVQETGVTLTMKRMKLTEDEVRMLKDDNDGKFSGDDLRKMIYALITLADRGESSEAV